MHRRRLSDTTDTPLIGRDCGALTRRPLRAVAVLGGLLHDSRALAALFTPRPDAGELPAGARRRLRGAGRRRPKPRVRQPAQRRARPPRHRRAVSSRPARPRRPLVLRTAPLYTGTCSAELSADPCPKLLADPSRTTVAGPFALPPPCLYVLPATIPSPRNNPSPPPQALADVQIMQAFNDCFGGVEAEINYVSFEVEH